ncbi:MAG: aromatic amino acid lyase [Acidimicrobiales bacterium]
MPDLVLGRHPVTAALVAADAASRHRVVLDPSVEPALRANQREASEASAAGRAYGRTTGVGANRNERADDADGGHGRRLVRSHATGAGPVLHRHIGRATSLIRASQLAVAGSGLPHEVLDALVRSLDDGRSAPVRRFGGLGTGDITGLAELALCLLGERAWDDGTVAAYLDELGADAALAFMSSSAPTLAAASLAASEIAGLVRASVPVAALSAHAVQANAQQWSPVAVGTRPSVGVDAVAASMRRLLGDGPATPPRTQDPLSFRCIPFVAGPVLTVMAEAIGEIDACIAANAENPRFADGQVWHHGSFMLTGLALRLDTARLGLVQWFATSVARLLKLDDPAYTGQRRFLADGPAGSSGVMVVEYTAASAFDALRGTADPVSRSTTAISVGTEDHATFANRGALALLDSIDAVRTVLACELLVALRAVRIGELAPPAGLVPVLDACASLVDDRADRPLVDDLESAAGVLPTLATWGPPLA